MDEYPDFEDEYDAMYADEMEMMRELEGNSDMGIPASQPKSSTSHSSQRPTNVASTGSRVSQVGPLPLKQLPYVAEQEKNTDPYDDLFGGSISDVDDDLLVIDAPSPLRLPPSSRGLIHSQPTGKENEIDTIMRNAKRRLMPDASEPSNLDTQLFSSNLKDTYRRKKPLLPMVDHYNNEPVEDTLSVDEDLELIQRIQSMRKRIKLDEGSGLKGAYTRNNCRNKQSIHRHLPRGEFQAITTTEGERFYLDKVNDEDFAQIVHASNQTQDQFQLLALPFRELKQQAEEEYVIMQSKLEACARKEAMEAVGESNMLHNSRNEANEACDGSLWVEKYRPKHYLDLLSDEATNRTVLQWVKLWDKVVFGREKKKKEKKVKPPVPGQFVPFVPKFNKFVPDILEEFDEIGRPVQKVILLHGPPGLGKTTLSHIIAKHAGYNVIEMNASDDRSLDVFQKNLENATTMKSVFGDDKRPNCLVIDEIDGAPAPSINLLVTLLSGKKPGEGGGKQKKNKKDVLVLKRPVICICNDVYSPALRALRQMAVLIQFPPTQSARLAQRLHVISNFQKLKADLSVLLTLCEKTENDIRSCLSVLQFVSSNSTELRLIDLEGATIGMKDYQKSLFSVWREIFMIPRPKKQRRINPHEQIADKDGVAIQKTKTKVERIAINMTLGERLKNVVKIAQSCGEYDKLIMGWFENYPAVKFKHSNLEPILNGLEWTVLSDILQKEIYHTQTWVLTSYVSLSFAIFHAGFATLQLPSISFPTKYAEYQTKLTKNETLLSMMCSDMSPYTTLFATKSKLVYDILPFMSSILQPTLRPVNLHLLTRQEKKDLGRLVDTMIGYNLTYQQDKTIDEKYIFTLDPNVEEVTTFPDIPRGKEMVYSCKQLVAREIELEKMRRSERYFIEQQLEHAKGSKEKKDRFNLGHSGNSLDKKKEGPFKGFSVAKKSTLSNGEVDGEGSNPTKVIPNHLQKLQVKKLNLPIAKATPRDFFGREIIFSASQQAKIAEEGEKDLKGSIRFKFKEGYSNAVRRFIKIKDFNK